MSFEDAMATTMRLVRETEALAALAARLELGDEGGDLAVRAALERVVEHLGVELPAISPVQASQLAATARTFVLQAAELVARPARAPGWVFEDPGVLQAQGVSSSMWAAMIERLAPAVAAACAEPGARLLDVGTGVGKLAIGACQQWPGLAVVGLDPWPPALALAHDNVAAAGLAARIELRNVGVETLAERARYHVAWIPGPFLPPHLLADALVRVHAALVPGGWAVLGVYRGLPDPLAQALTELRVVRSGGALLTTAEAAALLARAGFAEVAEAPPNPSPMHFVLARRQSGG